MAGNSKFSLSVGNQKPSHGSSLSHHHHHRHSNGTKRPHSALHDSDDSDDEGRHQEITHFDTSAGGAVHSANTAPEKKPLVIPVGNDSRKRQKSGLPSQNTEAAEAAAAELKAKAKPTVFGLNVSRKAGTSGERTPDVDDSRETTPKAQPTEKSADEEALQALLGNKATSNAVIPTLTDEETFQRDFDNAADVPTEADYDAVPIEEFGAAMLRGMGWKDGEAIGRNKGQPPIKERKLDRRPELLGVGAKPAKALGIELGEWGKHAKKHERKINQAYAPVMLKNKKTGEMITEEEMQQILKDQEMGLVDDEEPQEDEDRRSKDKQRRREKERDRDRDRDYGDRNSKSSRRDRSTSYDDRRRRRDDDDSDRERRERRRDKERRRRDRSESEDRYRSRKDDKYRDRDRDDKYRERDRDRRHRDDERSYRKERPHRNRSDRDRH